MRFEGRGPGESLAPLLSRVTERQAELLGWAILNLLQTSLLEFAPTEWTGSSGVGRGNAWVQCSGASQKMQKPCSSKSWYRHAPGGGAGSLAARA